MSGKLERELNIQNGTARSLIEEYCRLESVGAQNRAMPETANWVETLLSDTGFKTQQLEVPGAPNYVFAERKGASDFTLLLYNHYDVQPEDPIEQWESDPFEPTERNGNLYARGICDNKAELIARICALRALLAAYNELPITIKWIIEGEEEVGSPHFGDMTKAYGELLKADAAYWEGGGFEEDGRASLALGFKGMLYVEYEVEVMDHDAHSGAAPSLPSGAWRLLKAISSLKDEKGNIMIPGFFENVKAPTDGAKEALKGQPNMDKTFKEMYGIKAFNNNKEGYEGKLQQSFEPTANIAGFLSGYTEEGIKTVLPAKAMAKMDFRLVPEQSPDEILKKLRSHLDEQGFEDVQVKKLGGAEPVVTPIEQDFVQRMIQICEEFVGEKPTIAPLVGGTLPLLEAMKKNVGLLGISGSGNPTYYGSGAHAPNEHIRLKDIERAIQFNAFMFEKLGEEQ